jgi:hypothetical protein
MSDLEQIKTKIAATEAELATAKNKLKEAEDARDEGKIAKYEGEVKDLRALQIQQQEEKNLLLKTSLSNASSDEAKIAKYEGEVKDLRALLIQQQEKKNLLLKTSLGNASSLREFINCFILNTPSDYFKLWCVLQLWPLLRDRRVCFSSWCFFLMCL